MLQVRNVQLIVFFLFPLITDIVDEKAEQQLSSPVSKARVKCWENFSIFKEINENELFTKETKYFLCICFVKAPRVQSSI